MTAGLKSQSLAKEHAAKGLQGAALENQIRKNRIRWLQDALDGRGVAAGEAELGWPNTYTLTKSFGGVADGEAWSGVADCGGASRRSVETSVAKPFLGWNEGINTSASLSYFPSWGRISGSCLRMRGSGWIFSRWTRCARG